MAMKIAFVHDWMVNYQQELDWQDGLSAALKELEKRGHEVGRYVQGHEETFIPNPMGMIRVTRDIPSAVKQQKPDVILCWADMTRQNAPKLATPGIPVAICFAGGNPFGENVDLFDHIFVESKVYLDQYLDRGYKNVSLAFGTNTDLFQPIKQTKIFDTIFPATFAAWKRHNLYAGATNGLKSLAVGYMYDDHEQECWQVCQNNGVAILPHVSAQVLKYLYAASRVCVIPSQSDGGSQRTVLEAMAMNIPVVTCDSDKFDFAGDLIAREKPDSELLRNAIYALLNIEVNTRNYVLENYSHIQYANEIEKELKKLCAANGVTES